MSNQTPLSIRFSAVREFAKSAEVTAHSLVIDIDTVEDARDRTWNIHGRLLGIDSNMNKHLQSLFNAKVCINSYADPRRAKYDTFLPVEEAVLTTVERDRLRGRVGDITLNRVHIAPYYTFSMDERRNVVEGRLLHIDDRKDKNTPLAHTLLDMDVSVVTYMPEESLLQACDKNQSLFFEKLRLEYEKGSLNAIDKRKPSQIPGLPEHEEAIYRAVQEYGRG